MPKPVVWREIDARVAAREVGTYAGPSSRDPSLMTINSRAGSGSAQRPARASGSVGPQSR
jgi:hypothetical protein